MTQSDQEELDDYITDAEEEMDGDYKVEEEEEKEEKEEKEKMVCASAPKPQRPKRSPFVVLPDIRSPCLTPYEESLATFHEHLQLPHGGHKSEEAARADVAKVHLMETHSVPVHTGALLEVWGNEMLIWTQFFPSVERGQL